MKDGIYFPDGDPEFDPVKRWAVENNQTRTEIDARNIEVCDLSIIKYIEENPGKNHQECSRALNMNSQQLTHRIKYLKKKGFAIFETRVRNKYPRYFMNKLKP